MYEKFFGLTEDPFNVSPDPHYLCFTPQTSTTLAELKFGLSARKGFILLTGDAGTGKTTLINCLFDWLRQKETPTAFIFNCRISGQHLLEFILSDFRIPYDVRTTDNMLFRLNGWLMERNPAFETPVLIVDEAQGSSSQLLEYIRLLLNIETPSRKLLQIVLVGQPELTEKLRRPELRQLLQRVTLRCKTSPLSCEETHGYIRERLRIAGAADRLIFESSAMDAAHHYSTGIPRVLNLLCEQALINAYVDDVPQVAAECVEQAARDFLRDGISKSYLGGLLRSGKQDEPLQPREPAAGIERGIEGSVSTDPHVPPRTVGAPFEVKHSEETSGAEVVPSESNSAEPFSQDLVKYAAPACSAPVALLIDPVIESQKETSDEQSPRVSVSAGSSAGRNRKASRSIATLDWGRAFDAWWHKYCSPRVWWRTSVYTGLAGGILVLLSLLSQTSSSYLGGPLIWAIYGCLGVVLCAICLAFGTLFLVYSVKWLTLFKAIGHWLRQPVPPYRNVAQRRLGRKAILR